MLPGDNPYRRATDTWGNKLPFLPAYLASLAAYLLGRIRDEDGAGLRARAHLPSRPLQT